MGALTVLAGRPWRAAFAAGETTVNQAAKAGTAAALPPVQLRRYRADAAILLFGITIFRRAGVGSGQASLEESGEPSAKSVSLFFAAGSDPKRAHGLKRLGWIRETTLESGSALTEASYFGLMTSSPEDNLENAKKAINGPQAGKSPYSAVKGSNITGRSRSAITHFEYPTDADWSDQRLINEAQATFQNTPEWRETAWPNAANSVPSTFLYELARLLKQRARQATGRYVYNEKEYRLDVETTPQRQKGSGGQPLLMVRGKTRNQRTGHETPFRVWIEDTPGSVVPVRIEYQPRSFLRLTFEEVRA